MRIRRVRLRTLLIVVAVVAVALGGGIEAIRLYRRAGYFRQLAAAHAKRASERAVQEKLFRDILRFEEHQLTTIDDPNDDYNVFVRPDEAEKKQFRRKTEGFIDWSRKVADSESQRITYHLDLKRKYERAASRPWRSVTPDPPEPPEPE